MISTPIYQTNKEDNDPVLDLETSRISKTSSMTVSLFGFTFYRVTLKNLVSITLQKIGQLSKTKRKVRSNLNCVFPFDPLLLMQFRKGNLYKKINDSGFLNLPIGAGIQWMSRRFKKEIPETISISDYTMNLIRLAEAKAYSIFLFGGKHASIEKLFFNLKRFYPGLQIVGRHHARLNEEELETVTKAIVKANPHIILVGIEYKKSIDWMLKQEQNLINSDSVIVHLGEDISILTGEKKNAPSFFKKRNLVWLWSICKNPLSWFRFFTVIQWILYSLIAALIRKK